MKSSAYSIIIKVNDLDLCRMFYRDILDLGEPFLDSSFAVRFALAENLDLTLEKNQGAFLEHASSATAWMLECDDLPALTQRLADSGFSALTEAIFFGSSDYLKGRDPENNVFYVRRK